MQGDGERDEAQPPGTDAGDLQPQDWPAHDPDSSHEEPAERFEDGPADQEQEQRVAARLARLQADQELVERLRRDGFAGKEYEVFKTTLVGYGYSVMQAWIGNGQIFQLVQELGRPVTCSDELKQHLRDDVDDQRDLAADTVARTLEPFLDRALRHGGWDPAKGANLTTYFVGALKREFPNAFRPWARERNVRIRQVPLDDIERDLPPHDDPAEQVILLEAFRAAMDRAATAKKNPERLRFALAARFLQEATFKEIALDWIRANGTIEHLEDALDRLEDALTKQVRRWQEQHPREDR